MRRLFDIGFGVVMVPLVVPLVAVLAALVWICDGRPVFYKSRRMHSMTQDFHMWKLRTMTVSRGPDRHFDRAVERRVTGLGAVLRRHRLDELPQLWNLLRGDITLIGTRPPLPAHVRACPDLFREVLETPPGLTGLATLTFYGHEAAILSACPDSLTARRVYLDGLMPAKITLDRDYNALRTWQSDLRLLAQTALVPLRTDPAPLSAPARHTVSDVLGSDRNSASG
ncbi:MAG: sugar transferase [Pseudomonadota bacterium]|jgi:lipopolysaccharide/colanic/teichoic acid biosynthesis glycosyltransferase|nr:sugar transferase [Pseudomonadota bacterium]